jgi:hypothetical protein
LFDRTDAHITTWVVALILFFVALGLHNRGNAKGFKIVHMILRVFYILVILTGGMLFAGHQTLDPALYGVKALFGIIVIGLFEMILVRLKKGKKTNILWAILFISILVVLYLGLKLPLGFHPFA